MHTIDLEYPFTLKGFEYKTLNVRRPKVRDQLKAANTNASDEEKEVRMLADLCDVSPDVIQELDMIDYLQLQEVYSGFLTSEQTT